MSNMIKQPLNYKAPRGYITVTSYTTDTPGLVVCRRPLMRLGQGEVAGEPDPTGGWDVVHLVSGLRVTLDTLRTRKQAIQGANALGPLFNWHQDHDTLIRDVAAADMGGGDVVAILEYGAGTRPAPEHLEWRLWRHVEAARN